MSAYERITDSSRTSRHVRKVPPTDVRTIEMKDANQKEKAARKRLLNSNLTIVDQVKRNAGFAFRR
jgi:hypothetical protein